MCDDITDAENEAFLAERKLTRRELALLGAGAAALATLSGCGASAPAASEPVGPDVPATGVSKTVSRDVTIVTAEATTRELGAMQAALLIAIAQNDDAKQPEAKDQLCAAAAPAERPAEIEVYPAQHGWCAIDSPVHDREQAERAWSRMLATFEAYL